MQIPRPLLRATITIKQIWQEQVRPLFNLRNDLDEPGTIEAIERSADFRGAGVWTLFFAILIASIGLNVNSTAVIIGAMLISPLMGPIVAAGFALGVNHFELLKRAIKNLLLATFVGISASTLYFLISPLGEAQAELLARTRPTIYDVLIAICGGATGIIAASRRERSLNAISGVAIATALMPPLCTAGYGIAKGNPSFVVGALYLYIINSIFICLATFVAVRTLQFRKHEFVDLRTERRVSLYMGLFAILVAVPSVYTAYYAVNEAVFRSKANRYLSEVFVFPQTKILERRLVHRTEGNLIDLTLIGNPLPDEEAEGLRGKLAAYGLAGTVLTLNAAGNESMRDVESRLRDSLKSELMERFYADDRNALKSKDDQIRLLENEVLKFRQAEQLVGDLGPEMQALAPKVEGLSLGRMPAWSKGKTGAPAMVSIVRWKGTPSKTDKSMVDRYVRARLKAEDCLVIHERI